MPDTGGRCDAAERPVELLPDRVAVSHSLAHFDDMGIRIRLREDRVVAPVQVVADVLREATPEGSDLHLRRDERF